MNWPGSGFDPETGIFYTQAGNSAVTVGHYDKEEFDKVNPEQFKNKPRLPRWEADPNYGLPRGAAAGAARRPRASPGRRAAASWVRASTACRSSSRPTA